jgi:predicted RNase H-like HicB family nuclease
MNPDSAYVPELPTILVAGKFVEELRRRAAEAIQIWWEENERLVSPTALRGEVEVELPS